VDAGIAKFDCMKIIPLSEGRFTIDKSKYFIPFDEQVDRLQERAKGSLLVEIQPFLVITSKDILLLDTGLGFEKNGSLQLHQNISAAGINPGEITKVLLSHLHKDHAGGVCLQKADVQNRLSLPGATYYLQEKELNFAFETGPPSFITEELECLRNNRRVELLQGNGYIDGYIEYAVSGAHSPYHQVFWIREDEEIIFFGGDEAPQLQQMKHRFIAKYDADGKKAMEWRQQWWKQGADEHWKFLFYHDVQNPVWNF
jgi:glyoxylase-like metal-dependent hydrolase (beta-lactamase superfamily II)